MAEPLVDALPVGRVEIDQLPQEFARALFEALRLEIHYNKLANQARFRITLTGSTIAAARRTATQAKAGTGDRSTAGTSGGSGLTRAAVSADFRAGRSAQPP